MSDGNIADVCSAPASDIARDPFRQEIADTSGGHNHRTAAGTVLSELAGHGLPTEAWQTPATKLSVRARTKNSRFSYARVDRQT